MLNVQLYVGYFYKLKEPEKKKNCLTQVLNRELLDKSVSIQSFDFLFFCNTFEDSLRAKKSVIENF